MAQRDPLIEYQREGYDMFTAMSEGIKEETVGYLFNATVQAAQPAQPAPAAADGAAAQPAGAQAPAGRQAPPREAQPGGRRAPAQPAGGRTPAPAGDPTGTSSVLPAAFRGSRPTDLRYSGPAEDGSTTRTRSGAGRDGSRGESTATRAAQPSRNRPCPCGSGRKYKQCHGSPTAARP